MPHRTDPRATSHMTGRARGLRRAMTEPERRLWSQLRGRRYGGVKFRRQAPVGRYVVDFLCEQAGLVVELDGLSHVGRTDADAERTRALEAWGLTVLRVTNDDVLADGVAAAEHVLATARRLARDGPHPSPLPRGEGAGG